MFVTSIWEYSFLSLASRRYFASRILFFLRERIPSHRQMVVRYRWESCGYRKRYQFAQKKKSKEAMPSEVDMNHMILLSTFFIHKRLAIAFGVVFMESQPDYCGLLCYTGNAIIPIVSRQFREQQKRTIFRSSMEKADFHLGRATLHASEKSIGNNKVNEYA